MTIMMATRKKIQCFFFCKRKWKKTLEVFATYKQNYSRNFILLIWMIFHLNHLLFRLGFLIVCCWKDSSISNKKNTIIAKTKIERNTKSATWLFRFYIKCFFIRTIEFIINELNSISRINSFWFNFIINIQIKL